MRPAIILVIIAAIILAARCSGRAHAQDGPPASVPLLVSGVQVCHATPAPGGWYTARHCMYAGRSHTPAGGPSLPYSLDAGRDLAHLGAVAISAPLAEPDPGDHLTWRNPRGGGVYEAYAAVLLPGQYVPSLMLCPVSGEQLRGGDSGSGLWLATADGWALAAIFTHYTRAQDGAGVCPGGGMQIFATVVP